MATTAGIAPQPLPSPSKQDLNDAYSDLLDDLNEAYWAAASLDAKDQIKGVIDIVTDALTALDAADLTVRDAAYAALSNQVASVNGQLEALQAKINGIINRINVATSVITDITNVVSLAAELFPHI